MSNVSNPHATSGVQELASTRIPQPTALGAIHHDHFRIRLNVQLWLNDVLEIPSTQLVHCIATIFPGNSHDVPISELAANDTRRLGWTGFASARSRAWTASWTA